MAGGGTESLDLALTGVRSKGRTTGVRPRDGHRHRRGSGSRPSLPLVKEAPAPEQVAHEAEPGEQRRPDDPDTERHLSPAGLAERAVLLERAVSPVAQGWTPPEGFP